MTTQLEAEIAGLRARRRSLSFTDWLRTLPPFDRRSIREPAERDEYWSNVQQRLAVSDAASLMATRASAPPISRPSADLIG